MGRSALNILYTSTCFQPCAETFDARYRFVGPESALGPPPPNVLVRRHVPQMEVLRRAHAFVTHAGMNSVSEALYSSVPLVLVPQMGEQELIARRVEELGAGIVVTKEQASAETIRAAVRRVLTEERFRRQAGVIRESFVAAGGAGRAADEILAFVRGAPVTADLP